MGKMDFGPGLNKYTAYLRSTSKRLIDDGERVVEDAAEFGAERMREIIRTSGTAKSGKAGRIESEKMLNDVSAGEARRTQTGVAGNFGWGLKGDKAEDYFFYQEGGFRHWISGEMIPPMHALLGASVAAREYFYAEIRKIVPR